MEIIDNQEAWLQEYESNWLKHYHETGETNWKLYNIPRNSTAIVGKGVDLSSSRLVLISSAGMYLPASQAPFDAENDLGAYDIRQFPVDVTAEDLAIAHTHYDHTAVNSDLEVLVPLTHLKTLVAEGAIGELASDVISFMGYQPNAQRVAEETTPAIISAAQALNAEAALLVPS